MFGHTPLLEAYGIAVDSFKRVMNSFEYKDKIIHEIMKKLSIKSVDFIGSFMFFDPLQENELQKYYIDEDGNQTTDALTYKETLIKISEKIKNSKETYLWCCLGTIIRNNDISHHLSFLFKKEGDCIFIKMFNPGFFYLTSRYGNLTKQLLIDAVKLLGLKPIISEQFMTTFYYNPQDICRGGILGQIRSFMFYKYGMHNESYCQTWCILMMIYELKQFDKDYCFEKNYIQNWSNDQKTLEIYIREFILWIVYTFENSIPLH